MFFDLFNRTDINQRIEEYRQTEGAVLLDVRSREEYRSGHIPGSINIDCTLIQKAQGRLHDKNAPFFVYCLSGGRASGAVSDLKRMGYTNVRNIGGINGYTGKVEKGA